MVHAQHTDGELGQAGAAEQATAGPRALGSVPLLDIDRGIGPSPARRLLDVSVAAAGLALMWPLLGGLAVATRLSTGGSAIYRQIRVGQGAVPFTLLKFRTMRANAAAGPEVTAPGDHRVTRLGTLLRRTSLDELPQLVNVLRGDMTLVGPRPETVALAARYPADLQFVFRYRPGITGPTQVLVRDARVLRQAADVEDFYLNELVPRRVSMDLEYLRNPSMARTIGWFARTIGYLARTALRLL
jgi:lipopolysaccharide/colanic/teichoic acid biosynthesis glycosyltransferase